FPVPPSVLTPSPPLLRERGDGETSTGDPLRSSGATVTAETPVFVSCRRTSGRGSVQCLVGRPVAGPTGADAYSADDPARRAPRRGAGRPLPPEARGMREWLRRGGSGCGSSPPIDRTRRAGAPSRAPGPPRPAPWGPDRGSCTSR